MPQTTDIIDIVGLQGLHLIIVHFPREEGQGEMLGSECELWQNFLTFTGYM